MIRPVIARASLALVMGIAIVLAVQEVVAQSPSAAEPGTSPSAGAPGVSPTPAPGPGTLAFEFPARVDGLPLDVRSLTGQDLLDALDPADPAAAAAATGLTEALTSMGRSIDDLDIAWAILVTQAGTIAISAIRVSGSDGLALREALAPLFTAAWANPRRMDVTVAGKAAIELTGGESSITSQRVTLYAVDDTVWAISAPDAERAEILGALQ